MAVIAAVFAAVAVLCWLPGSRGRLRRLGAAQPVPSSVLAPAAGGAVIAVALLAVAWVFWGLRGLGWAVALVASGGTLAGLVWRAVRRRSARTARREVTRAARLLAGQLRIGQVQSVAVVDAASDCIALESAAAAVAIGADVPTALRRAAERPGQAGLASLAAAWELSQHSGAPIADSVDRVADELDASEAIFAAVAVEVTGARTTGHVMAVLPFVGLGLGYVGGGDPVSFLMGHPLGEILFVIGVLLAVAGVWWLEKLADVESALEAA